MSKDMKKKCLSCGGTDLFAEVTLVRSMPLADRNGTVKLSGTKVGQMDLKEAWDKEAGKERTIRGPIKCADCDAGHYFLVGDTSPLRLGDVAEARAAGYDALATPRRKK